MDASTLILCLGLAVGCALSARTLLHLFQLESYQFAGFFRSLRRNALKALVPGYILSVVGMVIYLLFQDRPAARIATGVLTAAAGAGILWMSRRTKEKKKFVPTVRVRRLWITLGLFCFLVLLLPFWSAARWVFPIFLPLSFVLAALIVWPVEWGIQQLYLQDAKRKLKRRPDLIKIGITGSYGKTSVKFILDTLLSAKYQVLPTPASFNTPMGLTRVIRERLQPGHQVFLAEMGARHRKDIRELCNLVHPQYGVLTSVGPQHLETFHSIENIRETKYDLIRALPPEGCAFFPDDGGICRELYDRTAGNKRLVSIGRREGATLWAENLWVSSMGSIFDLCDGRDSVTCKTKLLGEHNIQNILLASAVALELGVSLKQLQRGIAQLQPVEHRLELKQQGGLTVIDDAFNSNPVSARKALEVLKAFDAARVIVTPGMVELGEEEARFNREFGEAMASCVDLAILVGPKHTAPIREGLVSRGFPERAIHTVASLGEVPALLASLTHPGDTVLFENDLPDNYSET